MCAPSPPPAPDYAALAAQQGVANTASAKQQSMLNNPNVITPYGTQTTTYNGDQPTLTQAFSPEQQALYDQQVKTKGLIGGLGEQGATALQGIIGKPLDLAGLPSAPGSGEATRQKVIDAMMGRANEDYAKQSDQSNSDLIAAGIPVGSKAYGDRQQMIERSRNDARNLAEISGGNAATQEFGMDSQRRAAGLAELLASRQTPLNEVNSLMSGSQVTNPFAAPGYAQNTQVGQTPIYQAGVAAGDYGSDVYNQEVAMANAMKSGLFSLGGSALGAAGAYYGAKKP